MRPEHDTRRKRGRLPGSPAAVFAILAAVSFLTAAAGPAQAAGTPHTAQAAEANLDGKYRRLRGWPASRELDHAR